MQAATPCHNHTNSTENLAPLANPKTKHYLSAKSYRSILLFNVDKAAWLLRDQKCLTSGPLANRHGRLLAKGQETLVELGPSLLNITLGSDTGDLSWLHHLHDPGWEARLPSICIFVGYPPLRCENSGVCRASL